MSSTIQHEEQGARILEFLIICIGVQFVINVVSELIGG